MPRGADYDNGIPQSDNAIEAGPDKVHGTNPVRPSPKTPLSLSINLGRH